MIKIVGIESIPRLGNRCPENGTGTFVEALMYPARNRFYLGRGSNMRYWEIVADKLSAAGFSWGYCSAVTQDGWRWIVDANKGDGRRYIVESDELLTAFVELESAIHSRGELS